MKGFTTAGGTAQVTTDRGSYAAEKIIISAGAWLPGCCRARAQNVFTVRRQVLYWFKLKPGAPFENYRPDRFPVYIWQLPARQAIYGFPWTGEGAPTIKIATEQYDTATSPDAIDRTVSERETRAMYDEFVAPYFPGASPDCDRSAVCMYTCVDKARFIIDELPGRSARHRCLALFGPWLQAFGRHRRGARRPRDQRKAGRAKIRPLRIHHAALGIPFGTQVRELALRKSALKGEHITTYPRGMLTSARGYRL